jgi:hypothetical protein
MADEFKNESTESASETPNETRRTFVRTAAQVAVTTPAVALLLNAATIPASAASCPYGDQVVACKILDDFTYGNDQEDIDAKQGNTDKTNFGGNQEALDDAGVKDAL